MDTTNNTKQETVDNSNISGIPFRVFLERSTNLMTIFGILNVLFIFSASIDDTNVKLFLLPSFFLLSVFVWLEIILFTIESSDNSFRYEVFYFLSAVVELGLLWYFAINFYFILVAVGIVAAFFGLAYLLTLFLIWLLPSLILRFVKRKNISTKFASFIVVATAICLSTVILMVCLIFLNKINSYF